MPTKLALLGRPKTKLGQGLRAGVLAAAVALTAAGFVARNLHPAREIYATVLITNHGDPVRFTNLGEYRWSGAAFELFHPDDHVRAVVAGNAGDRVEVLPGIYDLRVTYSDGEQSSTKWIPHVVLDRDSKEEVELDVPVEAIGPQRMENGWKP